MNDRYPISGIKQSYRHTPETRTVILPILIVALLGGMGAFYFLGKPKTETPPVIVAEPIPEEDVKEETSPAGLPDHPAVPVSDSSSPGSTTVAEVLRKTPPDQAPTPTGIGNFTPWMSPAELDGYIRERNQGHATNFWKRGHWITAVEGRWNGDDHEFRIAYDKTPSSPGWQWQYRVNQTPEQFLENTKELRALGFRITQVQSFDHPDSRRRYQTVWERTGELPTAEVSQEPSTTGVVGASPQPVIRGIQPPRASVPQPPAPRLEEWTPSTVEEQPTVAGIPTEPVPEEPAANSRALDVNNLRFR